MRWLSRVTTAGIFVVLAGGVVLLLLRARPDAVSDGFRTSAMFRDALGLPVGSKVVIAGVTVGAIDRLTVEGNQARVGMRLRSDTILCDDAWATKKAVSALGDNYIELSPGDADPAHPSGCAPPHRRLRSGDPVPRVIEAASTDRVLRGVQNAIPRMEQGMAAAEALIVEGRQFVAGPFADQIAEIDRELTAGRYDEPLREVDEGADRLDRWTAQLEADLADLTPTANRRMDEAAADVGKLRDDLRGARGELTEALGTARARMDEADPYIDDAADVIATLSDPGHERPGALSALIHDPQLADDTKDLTEGIAAYTGSVDRLKSTLGFRTEVHLLAGAPRYYVTAEIAARADSFYLIELAKDHWGDVPAPTLTDESGSPTWDRATVIPEKLRFTAQWGHRFGPVALRAGLKESMFGIGVDAAFGGGKLKLSGDVIEASFARVPRIKLAAAFAIYRTLYVVGGIEDALVPSTQLPIQPWPDGDDVPIQFRQLHYGRDFFLGLNLTFTDQDVNRTLLLYGGLIGAILGRG